MSQNSTKQRVAQLQEWLEGRKTKTSSTGRTVQKSSRPNDYKVKIRNGK